MTTLISRSAGQAALLLLTLFLWIGSAWAQLPPAGTPSQFDLVGFIQEATLDPACATDPLCGGTLTVNGHQVVVPSSTIVILPANALTWQELFAQAPAPYSGTATGMALADIPAPLTTYEVHVAGNRVGDTYIAGLVNISQQDLNTGAGFINYIDYANHALYVGGALVLDANGAPTNTLDPSNPGAQVRINDPDGVFGPAQTPDMRFTLDPENPTIRSDTGFPMCLPRTDPAVADDPLCPQGNRLQDAAGNYVGTFTMPDPATLAAGELPDPRIQAPFEVGDYVTFAGNLVTGTTEPTAGPFPGTGGVYVSAHTLVNNTAIYTAPGTDPAYVAIDVTILGTGGTTVLGAGEAAIRTRFEGMSTDESRPIHLYAVDVNPDGTTTDRDWGTIGVDPGPPNGAVKGRWRFRPPCTAAIATEKDCTPPVGGTFLPPPREVRAVIEGLQSQADPAVALTAANGLPYGQYHAPILEYIFPESIPGVPPPPSNFETIPFLVCGGYASTAGTVALQLNPWPGAATPVCTTTPAPPVADAGADQTVASGATVTLDASASTGGAPLSFSWSQITGPTVTLATPNEATTTFTAPPVDTTTVLSFQVTVSNSAGSSTASVTITVNASAAPTVDPIAARTVESGTPVTLTATGTDPGGSSLTFHWTLVSGTPPIVLNPDPFPADGASVSFTPSLPVGEPAATLVLEVTATNAAGQTSAPQQATVTVNPIPDSITIDQAEYRTGKMRLSISATTSVVSPNVVLTLEPYETVDGTVFDPSLLGNTFVNTGGGIYTLDLVGAPEPALPPATPLTVKSNLGGVSAPSELTRVRR